MLLFDTVFAMPTIKGAATRSEMCARQPFRVVGGSISVGELDAMHIIIEPIVRVINAAVGIDPHIVMHILIAPLNAAVTAAIATRGAPSSLPY